MKKPIKTLLPVKARTPRAGASWLGLWLTMTYLTGCGSDTEVDFSESLTIVMLGTFEETAGASGNAEPRYVDVTFTDATVAKGDGSIVDLFDLEPVAYRILDRPQKLLEVDMSDYVDTTLSAITLSFGATVKAMGKSKTELSGTFAATTVMTEEGLLVEKAVKKRLEIHVRWKNAITRDDTTDPPTETLGSLGLSTKIKAD